MAVAAVLAVAQDLLSDKGESLVHLVAVAEKVERGAVEGVEAHEGLEVDQLFPVLAAEEHDGDEALGLAGFHQRVSRRTRRACRCRLGR